MCFYFSEPLPPRRPAKPTYLLHTNNGISIEVLWKRPVSYYPIIRYLVHLVMVGDNVADKEPPILLGLNSNCTEVVVNATMPAVSIYFINFIKFLIYHYLLWF